MMASQRDREFYSGTWKAHGVNVQVIADPADRAGRLVWVSPALPGSVHDIKAARTHQILTELDKATVMTFADTHQHCFPGLTGQRPDPAPQPPQRPGHQQEETSFRWSEGREQCSCPGAGDRERANAQLKNWRVLRKIRSCPHGATRLVNAIQTLILAG